MALFQRVRARLSGKCQLRQRSHDFTLRGLFRCSLCGRHLTGELQKGHVYYRCHTMECPTKSFREDSLEEALFRVWPVVTVSDEVKGKIRRALEAVRSADEASRVENTNLIRARLADLDARMARLIDAFVDNMLDQESFAERKRLLLEEKRSLQDRLETPADGAVMDDAIMERFELATSAQQSYRSASPERKREIVILLSSNRTVSGNEASVEPYFPVQTLENVCSVTGGDPVKGVNRTMEDVVRQLVECVERAAA